MFRQYRFEVQFHKPRYFTSSEQLITRQLLQLLTFLWLITAPGLWGSNGYSHFPLVLTGACRTFKKVGRDVNERGTRRVHADVKRKSALFRNIKHISMIESKLKCLAKRWTESWRLKLQIMLQGKLELIKHLNERYLMTSKENRKHQ